MSGRERQPAAVTMRLPDHVPGDDPVWDALGENWSAIDGAIEGTRLYVRWSAHQDGRSELTGLHIEGVPIDGALLRSVPVGRLTRAPVPFNLSELAPLRQGKGELREEFIRRVAAYYGIFAQVGPHPSKALAEHAHVPLGTARNWTREARIRGYLPPGTQGRAG